MTSATPSKEFGFFQRKSQVYASLPVRFNQVENESKIFTLTNNQNPTTIMTMCPSIANEQNDHLSVNSNNCHLTTIETASSYDVECNINDCLQDLDNYLEEIDRHSLSSIHEEELATSSFQDNNESQAESQQNVFQIRRHHLRKTVDYRQMRKGDEYNEFSPSQLWRCSSAKDMTFSMPTAKVMPIEDHAGSTANNINNTTVNEETLTQDHIFNNLIHQCNQEETNQRPRQFGRRATGLPTILNNRTQNEIIEFQQERCLHPTTTTTTTTTVVSSHNNQPLRINNENLAIDLTAAYESDGSIDHSTRNTSPISLASTSNTSISSNATSSHIERTLSSNITNDIQNNESQSNPAVNDEMITNPISMSPSKNDSWPHALSQSFALISCTLGLFNLCRFGVLTINYGGNFVLQFLLLSILFGIPLLWLQMCLGAKIKSGPVTMWRICPICKGIGISLMIVHFIVAIYSSVAVSWIFIYLRDTVTIGSRFPGRTQRWELYNDTTQIQQNFTHDFTKILGSYFSYIVLQRKTLTGNEMSYKVNEKLAFYLAILWTSIFLILCKGLKFFGRFVYLLGVVPITLLAVITIKLIIVVNPVNIQNIFSSTDLDDFLINPQTWAVAAQEAFLTWGFLGPSIISITSRVHINATKTTLRKNAVFVVMITFLGLAMMAIVGLCCLHILEKGQYAYVPGSFEHSATYAAIFYKPTMDPNVLSFPKNLVPHYSSFVGEIYRRPFTISLQESGYQALRFITEVIPAAAALVKVQYTWPWIATTFLTFLLFGFAQLCIMWKPISSALGNSISAVLLSCVTGLLLSIPFATESGINLLYYADLIFGASWIVPILWTALIFGVFLIRGRPYNGDDLVNDLKMSTSLSAYLALAWNILLPVGLPILSVIDYKISNTNQFYAWRDRNYRNSDYQWPRKLAAFSQTTILLLIPIVAIIQIIRYLRSGPTDILERFQLLFRPNPNGTSRRRINRNSNLQNSNIHGSHLTTIEFSNCQDDNPPKYTPPPSYTTATGARLAKMHQSIRRSVRRILRTARSAVFETEREIIISDISNLQQAIRNPTPDENIPQSFVQVCGEIENSNISEYIASEPPTRQRRHKRPSSAPRILQNMAMENLHSDLPRSLTRNRTRLRSESHFRSNEYLTYNAAPLGESQPPQRTTIHDIQHYGNDSIDNEHV